MQALARKPLPAGSLLTPSLPCHTLARFYSGSYASVTFSEVATGFTVDQVLCYGSGSNCVRYMDGVTMLLFGSAVVCAGAVFFLFPAWVCAAVAAIRLRGATLGVPPPVSCCSPSFPVIQALAWVGTAVLAAGAATNYAFSEYLFTTSESPIGNPGAAYLGFALACAATAATLFSVAGCCCIGHLPGLGRSATCCCCVETEAARANGQAAAPAALATVALAQGKPAALALHLPVHPPVSAPVAV